MSSDWSTASVGVSLGDDFDLETGLLAAMASESHLLASQMPRADDEPRAGARYLIAALIGDGIECATDPKEKPDERDEARRWVRSRSTSPATFEWACELLRLDPWALRRAMERAIEGGVHLRARPRACGQRLPHLMYDTSGGGE